MFYALKPSGMRASNELETQMRIFYPILFILSLALALPANSAALEARIDVSQQKMYVYKHGKLVHKWKVSTGRKGYRTPRGSYRPTRMYKEYYSKKYYNSPMPYSIFFRGGYAIHGTGSVKALGRPASHGCIRLHPRNAAKLYSLVRRAGSKNTKIKITN